MPRSLPRAAIRAWLDELCSRMEPTGAWPLIPGRSARPDATAWAVLALAAWDESADAQQLGRDRLVDFQREDGGVPLVALQPAAIWPTALAMLAWSGSVRHALPLQRGADRLLEVETRFEPDGLQGHDPSLRGWPWIAGTHPWVEPTALSLLALHAAARADCERFREGLRMLLDRQLPDGGWNYGNTSLFGSTLRPLPGPTGLALAALAGHAEAARVERSLAYAREQVGPSCSPRSLGLLLIGLDAWQRPAEPPRTVDGLDGRDLDLQMTDQLAIALAAFSERPLPGLARAESAP
ncbi:MAG: hypothetical protein JXR96_18525 [Deltaproteobacteria bacterium]|nr:hypothetical protein [Deltaproteobacteria bacterium]